MTESLRHTYERFWTSLKDQEVLLSRHVVGSIHAKEVRLNAMDWYQGDAPWHQLHMPNFRGNGRWAIEVKQAGTYRFEWRHRPREAPAALVARSACLEVGGSRSSVALAEDDPAAVITLALQPGNHALEARASFRQRETTGRSPGGRFLPMSVDLTRGRQASPDCYDEGVAKSG